MPQQNTQAAPWQLTTHSQLSNAAQAPKRPLFNVTRWHCVMQAKYCDMICRDSLLKWKYCTCGGHCCPKNQGRMCRESDMLPSPLKCARGCSHQELLVVRYTHILIYRCLVKSKTTQTGSHMLCHSDWSPFHLYKWKLKGQCQAPMLNHHLRIIWKQGVFCVMGFLKGSARLGYSSWQRFGTSQAERGLSDVTMVTLAHHAGMSGKSLQ